MRHLVSMLVVLASGAAHADGSALLVEHVRTANNRLGDVSVAVSEGYGPIPCTGGSSGGMTGITFVNPDLLKDDMIDIAHPEAVVYEPTGDGKLELVAVEYLAFQGPAELEGHSFRVLNAPNPYGGGPLYNLRIGAWQAGRSVPAMGDDTGSGCDCGGGWGLIGARAGAACHSR